MYITVIFRSIKNNILIRNNMLCINVTEDNTSNLLFFPFWWLVPLMPERKYTKVEPVCLMKPSFKIYFWSLWLFPLRLASHGSVDTKTKYEHKSRNNRQMSQYVNGISTAK